MKGDHFDGDENIIDIRDGEWRSSGRSGRVVASIPILTYPFSELAVLDVSGDETPHYAARLGKTDHWAHFYYLHSWMYPFITEYLTMQRQYAAASELAKQTYNAFRGAE
jgi:hypothetical protein